MKMAQKKFKHLPYKINVKLYLLKRIRLLIYIEYTFMN